MANMEPLEGWLPHLVSIHRLHDNDILWYFALIPLCYQASHMQTWYEKDNCLAHYLEF